MMKNRDTASNPYRVPRQPTPRWIVVAIVGLFLSNVALIGGVVFLVFSTEQCTKTCRGVEGARSSFSASLNFPSEDERKSQVMSVDMPRDDVEDPIQAQQESILVVTGRVDNVEKTLARLQSTVATLDELCRKRNPGEAARSTEVIITPPVNSLLPSSSSIPNKITKLESKLMGLEIRLKDRVKLCKEGHFRHGMYCYYVGEAKIPQGSAKGFCENDFGAMGTLAVIKDKFVHEFVVNKLPNNLNSYWVGIERQQQRPDTWISHSIPSKLEENKDMMPSPLSSSSQEKPPLSSTSSSGTPFDYVDGTKVQNKVWQTWGPRANRHDDRRRRDCVALSHDKSSGKWHWQDYACGERLGYVCQYFIMVVG